MRKWQGPSSPELLEDEPLETVMRNLVHLRGGAKEAVLEGLLVDDESRVVGGEEEEAREGAGIDLLRGALVTLLPLAAAREGGC